jgi:pimeloyl-ACP methyl ester carboxylesterase
MGADHWLLLRGLGREAEHWHELPELLGRTLGLPHESVICLDLPGAGTERQRKAPWTIPRTVADLRRRWMHKHDRPPGRWGIIGISMGGMLALEWASRHPEDFVALVVINASDRRSGTWVERLRWQSLPLMVRIALVRSLRRREELVLDLTTAMLTGERRFRVLEERIDMARRNPTPAMAVVRQLVAAAIWTAPPTVRPPILLLGAGADRMVSPGCSTRMAERLRVPVIWHPEAGHDLPLDDPEWVCARVGEGFEDCR